MLRMYAAALPKLEAEAQLSAIRVAQLGGSASFDMDALKDQVRELENIADVRSHGPKAARASAANMAAMGIGAIMVGADGLPIEAA